MIYADTPVCEWHVNQLTLSNNLNVAVYHMPYPYNTRFADTINQALAVYDRIAILISELHSDSVTFCQQHQHPKIKYFTCGTIQDIATIQWMDWFITTCEYYKNTNILAQLNPYAVKPKAFDILLGWRKPHRDIVNERFNTSTDVILTYLTDRTQSIHTQGIWEVDIPQGTSNTITQVNHLGHHATISQLIPVNIYNQTAYSVVAETNYDNHYSFYTEKIVKPILASRLFVVFSGQHYLRNLCSLGFKTFSGIIDETYDTVEDSTIRFNLACEQIDYLISQPQELILDKIKPIVEHNKQIMLTTNWLANHLKELQEFLHAHTS